MITRRKEQGVALVVTLILLAVITIVVVAFLGVSQRNRSLTTTATDQVNAQFMADAGLERAQAEAAARILTQPDLAPVQMLVSTNYTRWAGFDPLLPANQRFFNVSYTRTPFDIPNEPGPGLGPIYDPTRGVPLAYDELMQVLTNLYYNPRPPVFVRTNPSPIFPADFRFYLDLNRNGRFDATGNQFVLNDLFQPIGRATLDGDPEWIGVLEHPDVPHSATNRFIGRYAYLVVPEGLTIDLNASHNYAKAYAPGGTPDVSMGSGDRFLRNGGVGTYELNLAGFLVGLNTNAWPGWRQTGNPALDYFYDWGNPATANSGVAFNDAWRLLRYRYRDNPIFPGSANLTNLYPRVSSPPPESGSLEAFLGNAAASYANTNRVDEYANGPIALGENLPATELPGQDPIDFPWSGSPNPSRFFAIDELFDVSKVPADFVARLEGVIRGNSTYNSGTYYRLLSQLGTDSGAEPDSFVPGLGVDWYTATNPLVPYRPADRINLNWDNRDLRAQGGAALKAADLVPWEPLAFFTNAAARMLRSQVFVGSDSRVINLTNIMVWPTNNYDGAVHRILQVAANLYDSLNKNGLEGLTLANEPKFPTVFRPYLRKEIFTDSFSVTHTNIYIAGYQVQDPLVNPTNFVNRANYWDLNSTNIYNLIGNNIIPDNPDPNVIQPLALGVPLVVGAKKGFPNFNEIAMETVIQMQRNIQLRRLTRSSLPYQTNEFYMLGITNVFGVEAWNSYQATYPRALTIAVEVDYDMALFGTNAALGGSVSVQQWPPAVGVGSRPIAATFAASTALPAAIWGGSQFQVPLMTNYLFLSNSVWKPTEYPRFTPAASNVFALNSATPNQFFIPDWNLTITNRVRYVVTDTVTGRIVDYANLDRMNWSTNVVDAMTLSDRAGRDSEGSRFWDMRRHNNTTQLNDPTEGLWNQLMVSLGFTTVPDTIWRNYSSSAPTGQDKELAIDAFRRFAVGLPGLAFAGRENPISPNGLVAQAPFSAARRLELSRSYEVNDPFVHFTSYDLAPPAGANDPVVLPAGVGSGASERLKNIRRINKRYQPWAKGEDAVATSPIYIDPLITSSDDWQFPDHKLPNVGWIGRVHRGTPWQTVFLKSTNVVTYDVNGVRSAPANGLSLENWYNVQRTRGAANEYGLPNYSTPDKDWRFLDLFTTAPSSTATRGKVSVNQSGDASWSAVLSGVQVLTNRTGSIGGSMNLSGSGGGTVIEPGSLALRRIVDGINLTRNSPPFNGQFRTLGDLLSVPELSLSSPYLNRLPAGQEVYENISDAALERIPQQIASLLRLGEPRVVVYAFGQSLKPAPFSINLDPNYLNVVTNYQITGEFATRSVVEFQRVPPDPNYLNLTNQSRLRAVILESKVLPPQ